MATENHYLRADEIKVGDILPDVSRSPVTRPTRWALNAASAVLGFSLCAFVLTLCGVL